MQNSQSDTPGEGLDEQALDAARVKFLEIFGDPSAVPADYGLVAATIRAYLEALASPAPPPVEPPMPDDRYQELLNRISELEQERDEALIEVERYVAVAREEGDWRRATESLEKQVRAALEPFADFEDHGEPDDKLLSGYWADICNETITFGHMRRLRALKEGGA